MELKSIKGKEFVREVQLEKGSDSDSDTSNAKKKQKGHMPFAQNVHKAARDNLFNKMTNKKLQSKVASIPIGDWQT